MNKFYLHSLPQPFHLSVGAVLFNDTIEICVHHFYTKNLPEHLRFHAGELPDYYHLMRESVEGNEPLHDAVVRGIYEEFGAEGAVDRYLGSIECVVTTPQKSFVKTTLYHAVRLVRLGERPQIDEESGSIMEWYKPNDLLEIFEKQKQQTNRPELDETEVIKRFITVYG